VRPEVSTIREVSVSGDVDILHHIGLITGDMGALIERYEALGFMFTPLSMPRIVLRPGAEPELLGAGNRHAIFQNNYLEVLGVVDKERWDHITKEQRGSFDIDPPLARYQGLHVLHFGADDIETVRRRLVAQAIACSEVGAFQRNVETPAGARMMQAKYLSLPQGGNLPSLTQIAQHVTPELVLQPRYMQHRNGARSLTETIVCDRAPETLAARYGLYAGRPVQNRSDCSIVELGRSRIVVVTPERLGGLIPGAVPPTVPFLAGFTVATDRLDTARGVLAAAAVPCREHGGRVIVSAADAFGSAVLFEAEGATR
jgi:Glyoxalase-like domain